MVDPRRYSPQTIAVLGGLAAQPTRWRYGYELGQQVGLKSGSLYPILMRLADQGLLESIWDPAPPPGRPPRHLYRLSTSGRVGAPDRAAAPEPTRRQRPQPAGAS